MKWGMWAVSALGVAMMAYGVFTVASNTWFWIRAESVQGVISSEVEIAPTFRDRSRELERAATSVSRAEEASAAFETPDGESHLAHLDWGLYKGAYEIGDEVTVLYLPEDPSQARIKGFVALYLPPTALAFMGLVFFGLGFVGRALAE